MSFLSRSGAALEALGKGLVAAILVLLLLNIFSAGLSGLGLINDIATALIGEGVLGYYGLAAGVTMLALTGSKVWGMIGFAVERAQNDDVLRALSAIVGRGLRRGIPAFLEILLGGVAWPITALGWLGVRGDRQKREELAEVREYHALRREIDRDRARPETPALGGGASPSADSPLPDRDAIDRDTR